MRWMNLDLKKYILGSFIIISIFVLLTGIVGFYSSNKIFEKSEQVINMIPIKDISMEAAFSIMETKEEVEEYTEYMLSHQKGIHR
jgi:predicted PurR-regulated permease PerM